MRTAVSRAPDTERVVSPLELFFDLVYASPLSSASPHQVQ
jgi:low temperature requirement protein LtrA